MRRLREFWQIHPAAERLKLNDLTPIFKTKSIASTVLNGRRRLTVEQINKLATFFNLPHDLFFEPVAMARNLQDVLSSL